MSQYQAIKAAVNAYIKTNGRQEITGAILNAVMISTIDSLGRFFQFVGNAVPDTDPGNFDQNIAYLASTPGTYTHLGGFALDPGEVAILKFDGEWNKESLFTIPLKVSDLANDIGFITRSVTDLLNYYDKGQVDELIGSLVRQSYLVAWDGSAAPVVADIPAGVVVSYGGDSYTGTLQASDETIGKIYLVSNGAGYDQYVTSEISVYSWVGIGSTALDLSGYATSADLDGLSEDVPHTGKINGQNLYNPAAATHAYVDSRNGNVIDIAEGVDTRIKATEFIDIGVDGVYVANGTTYGSYGGWAVYDEDKNFLRGGRAEKPSISYQAGDRYIRATIDSGSGYNQQINIGSSLITPVVPYVAPTIVIETPNFKVKEEQLPPLNGSLLANESVPIEKCSFTDTITGKNLLNPSLQVTGRWIKSDGTTANVTNSYGYYGYTAVEPETEYHISNASDNALSTRTDAFIAFYDASKAFISSVASNTKNITTPVDCRFVRISYEVSRLSSPQMEVGSVRTTYEAYFAPYKVIKPSCIVFPDGGVTTQKIADGAVTQEKIAAGVSVAPRPAEFRGFRVSDPEISATQSLATDLVYVAKDVSIVADITGSISSVSVGVSRMGTYGRWAEITPTKMIIKYGSSGNVLAEYNHGLTLGTRTKVIITKTITSTSLTSATIKIVNDYGDVFSQNVTWGVVVGRAFVYNGGSSQIGAELSFMLRDLTKQIWMFGDSYFSFDDSKRWTHYPITWGFLSYLMNARGGETATQALADLNVLLSLGFRPSYIVWTLGMNSGADSGGAVNPTWLGVTEQVIDLCDQYGITPILATIPSVPSEIHEALNTWVRSSGVRYIDFAKAVQSDTPGDYHWRGWGTSNALLSSDEVHPSARGAVELAMQALLDFPEMTIKEN